MTVLRESGLHDEAALKLERGHTIAMEHASKIEDPKIRASYLTANPDVRWLIEASQKTLSD